MAKLNPKQAKFVAARLKGDTVEQAEIAAGYRSGVGHQLLRKVQIQDAIRSGQADLAVRSQITAERVMRELAAVGFANIMDYMRVQPDGTAVVDLSTMTREQAAALSEIQVEEYMDGDGENVRPVKRVKIRMASKLDALKQIAAHLGMVTERRANTGPDGAGPVEVKHQIDMSRLEPGERAILVTAIAKLRRE